MTLHPMLSALRHHKAGVFLIALQIALTLAIVCNAIFIIGHRIQRINRPSGVIEKNLFIVSQAWVGAPTGDDPASVAKLDALQVADINTLRQLPDVQSVAAIQSLPLLSSTWSGSVDAKPGKHDGAAHAAYYFGDQSMLSTLGLKLVAGRDFTAADVGHRGRRSPDKPPITIITRALAKRLFPDGQALGKTIYMDLGTTPTRIVGIVERMQSPSVESWSNSFAWNSMLFPVRLDAGYSRYAVRAKPGREAQAMKAARKALFAANPMRVMPDTWGVQSFSEVRGKAYRADRGMAILMSVICVILLAVTAAGIVGLTSFWVGQRQKQIGVRRALGARRVDILRYFQAENLLIAGVGAVVGIALAVGLNLWLMHRFEMNRIPVAYVLLGVVVVMALGQAAVFMPARRASGVPPVVATRSV